MQFILNNRSKEFQGQHMYPFWFGGDLVRVLGDKPFARGDLAELQFIDDKNKTLEIKVQEELEIPEVGGVLKIPTIAFATTKPLAENSQYKFESTYVRNSILAQYEKVLDGNKIYLLVLKLFPGLSKVVGIDELTGNQIFIQTTTEIELA